MMMKSVNGVPSIGFLPAPAREPPRLDFGVEEGNADGIF